MLVKKTRIEERVQVLKEKAREVRYHIIDMIYTAQSGHPGSSLSAVEIMVALYFDLARVDPTKPRWPDRDRIILSKGHGCPVWYACLALRGFFPLEELKTLRRFESRLQGHPDKLKTPGVDMTTGSLGQGLSLGVGMALEGKLSKKNYSVFVVLGDGELDEGQIWEASAAATKYKLDNLIAIVDCNRLQMDGFTENVMPMEPIDRKFGAFGWKTRRIDGHDLKAILTTIEEAKVKAAGPDRGKPFCIVAETVKGKGVSFMENVRVWHGKTPNEEQYQLAIKEILGEL
jgi:transketolase